MDETIEGVPELYMDDAMMDEMAGGIEFHVEDDAGMPIEHGTVTKDIDGAVVAGSGLMMLIWLGFMAVIIVSLWKIFTKAGQPGWASLIPFYNLYIMLKIASKPGWWILLFFIPIVGFIFAIIMWNEISKAFGKGIGYTLGLIFLGIIFMPMLAFGDAQYTKPVGEGEGGNMPPQDPTPTPQTSPQTPPQNTGQPTV